jgi:membrane associated rhomboid family serine protease
LLRREEHPPRNDRVFSFVVGHSSRIKITKDVLIFIATFLLVSFLGGVAGLFTNFYMNNLFEAVVGSICAILLSFVIGYLVRKGITKLSETSP